MTEPPTPPTPIATRRRDPEARRAAILQATREALTENGYARTTIRDIARRAGVTHGLVMRHFGSKERLMIAALPAFEELEGVIEGDPATLPERIAHTFVTRMERGAASDPFMALIRSAATNEQAAHRLYQQMQERGTAAYRRVLDADDLEDRIGLVGAQLIGVTFVRYVVQTGAVAEMSPQQLEDYLAGILRHILGPALPSPR